MNYDEPSFRCSQYESKSNAEVIHHRRLLLIIQMAMTESPKVHDVVSSRNKTGHLGYIQMSANLEYFTSPYLGVCRSYQRPTASNNM